MPVDAPAPLIFSHGNSFPASTYGVLLDSLRDRGFEVRAIEKFGHDPQYPVTDNWPHLVSQLADFARGQARDAGGPVFMAGHSLGGLLSLMCAALHPSLVRGVVMLDSPLVGGWRAGMLGFLKRTPWLARVSPGSISRKRRDTWAHRDAVLAHFSGKKAFADWDARVLRDYIEHGTFDVENARALSFGRDIETAIYDTIPHNMGPLLRAHPLRCPAAFIGGRQSLEVRRTGLAMTRRVTEGRIMMLDGTHLFPMERPIATAAAVEASLLNFG